MLYALKESFKKALPSPLLSAYHLSLAWLSAACYGFPSRKLIVVGVTGTKGKSSVSEMTAAIFEEAGFKTALANTIRFKTGDASRPNLFKMTMPGRGYLQKVLAEAVRNGCTHAVLEVSSEGARQYRNAGIALDALIFTHISPEHIESHGSYENYKKAKLGIGWSLVRSSKRPRTIIANAEDELGKKFLALPVERVVPFPGEFTVMNALAAASAAASLGVSPEIIAQALSCMKPILGRAEKIEAGQPFSVIVDYAHTSDSLRALFEAYPQRKICVFGATGSNRDHWKRPQMGKVAEEYCAEIILTNDDPYDEDPENVVRDIQSGMTKEAIIELDRRLAIRHALSLAKPGDAVLIAGKGTDPFLMEAGGKRTPWSDARVAREELERHLQHRGEEPSENVLS